jgi:DNA-3-methyladenine glycosylase
VSPDRFTALPAAFYERPTVEVARALLGKVIVRRWPDRALTKARIVEVEAYLGLRDAASHARRGPTPRSAIMFGPPGRLYVYLIYGMHHCMNFVTEADGVAGAVLIRAAEPLGEDLDPRATSGPGKICAALGITLHHKGLDLTDPDSELLVVDDGSPAPRIAASRRVGVEYAGAWGKRRLRFFIPRHPCVSGPR